MGCGASHSTPPPLLGVAPDTPSKKQVASAAASLTPPLASSRLDGPLERLSIPELRFFIIEAGLEYDDILDKENFVDRARGIGPLELLRPKVLRRLIKATGYSDEGCIEKGDLVTCLRAAIEAGGRATAAARAAAAAAAAAAAVAAAAATEAVERAAEEDPAARRKAAAAEGLNGMSGGQYIHRSAERLAAWEECAEAEQRHAAVAEMEQRLASECPVTPADRRSAARERPATAERSPEGLMLEARLQIEAERREAAVLEKREVEAQLAEARSALQAHARSERTAEAEAELQMQSLHTQVNEQQSTGVSDSSAPVSSRHPPITLSLVGLHLPAACCLPHAACCLRPSPGGQAPV